jgi:hypothetical protein
LEFSCREATTLRFTYTHDGGCKELIVASAYLPYDSNERPPTKQFIIQCDANEHNIFWGSTGRNPRGFLVISNLNILNHGNEPSFVVCNRKEVIDLILGTNKMVNLVSNWQVSDEPPISDHRYTCFQIGNISINQVTFRNPRRAFRSHITTT